MRFPLHARVLDGYLVLDERGRSCSCDDDLDDADRARLHESLKRSAEQFAHGQGIPAEDALRRLRGQEREVFDSRLRDPMVTR